MRKRCRTQKGFLFPILVLPDRPPVPAMSFAETLGLFSRSDVAEWQRKACPVVIGGAS
jgi:hypothetical protein